MLTRWCRVSASLPLSSFSYCGKAFDVLHTTVFGQVFLLKGVVKSWLLDFLGHYLKESWTWVVSFEKRKKKTGVEFLTGIQNLGHLPHNLLAPVCGDCCNIVVDGLSPSGYEGGGLMWRLPVWSKVSINFRWNAVRPISPPRHRSTWNWPKDGEHAPLEGVSMNVTTLQHSFLSD